MTNIVLLNNVDHADLKVSPARGAALGDAVNQAAVVPTEFIHVQREFPILLRQDQAGGYQSVALLGFDSGENLFLDGDRWTSRYIPAVLERGPFTIGFDRQSDRARAEPMINIDLDHPSVGVEDGAPLFLKHGGNAPYLERAAAILRRLHMGLEVRKSLFDALARHDLIEPVSIEGEFAEGMTFSIPGFSAVSIDRLNALGGDALQDLNQSGHLYAAYMMVASLNNIGRLIELKGRKVAAQTGRGAG